jgi:hypothetical protein
VFSCASRQDFCSVRARGCSTTVPSDELGYRWVYRETSPHCRRDPDFQARILELQGRLDTDCHAAVGLFFSVSVSVAFPSLDLPGRSRRRLAAGVQLGGLGLKIGRNLGHLGRNL